MAAKERREGRVPTGQRPGQPRGGLRASLLAWFRTTQRRPSVLTAVGVLVYGAAMHVIYAVHISPVFAGEGLTYRAPVFPNYAAVLLLVAGVGVILPRPIVSVSHFMLWVLFLLVGAPSALIAQYSRTLPPGQALVLGVATTIVFGVLAVALRRGPPKRASALWPSREAPLFWPVIAAVSIAVYGYLFVAIGIHLSHVSMLDPYGMRAEYVRLLAGAPGLGYLVPTQFSVLNPLIVIEGMARRRLSIVATGVVLQVVLYVTTGERSIFFSIILVPLVYLLAERRRVSPAALTWTVVVSMAAAWLLDVVTRSPVFTSILVRRFLIVPGALTSAYVAVFSGRPKGRFSDVVPLIPSPYHQPAVQIVGRDFTHETSISANASWLAHGYYSFGYLGLAAETLLVVILLWSAQLACRRLSLSAACALFTVPIIALASSSPFTTILSHGYLVALLVASTMPLAHHGTGIAGTTLSGRLRARARPRAAGRERHG